MKKRCNGRLNGNLKNIKPRTLVRGISNYFTLFITQPLDMQVKINKEPFKISNIIFLASASSHPPVAGATP